MPASTADIRDLDLVRQTLTGSRDAFALLVVRYSRSVRASCLARVGRVGDLDDIIQETFLRAYKGLSRLRDQSRFGPYVHRIAQNICVDRFRRKGQEPVSLDEVDLEAPHEPNRLVDVREERMMLLRRLVGRLPEALREAVLLFYFEQLTYADIAVRLGLTEAAVNQRLHRARLQLKQGFGEAGEVVR